MVGQNRKMKDDRTRPTCSKEERLFMMDNKTSIQLTASTRDRLYKLKFRRTYDQFINELCDLYEREKGEENPS